MIIPWFIYIIFSASFVVATIGVVILIEDLTMDWFVRKTNLSIDFCSIIIIIFSVLLNTGLIYILVKALTIQ